MSPYIGCTFSGMLSAAASLGLIHLWDVHGGLTPIDKYLYTSEEYIKVNIEFLYLVINKSFFFNNYRLKMFRLVLSWLWEL